MKDVVRAFQPSVIAVLWRASGENPGARPRKIARDRLSRSLSSLGARALSSLGARALSSLGARALSLSLFRLPLSLFRLKTLYEDNLAGTTALYGLAA
ncbi:hypothetical protein FA95DRAFT_1562067 [Auriscalpium vulgare]|uniref:Uncharacterized protein n=1 Tax=Auriscalpium vulgare TaxID=40419 RepID=A0ACB8RL54_9AGAM|nr:hypothetical protein FA95DRAFT_1562067 [Auriscalpium vulgare]